VRRVDRVKTWLDSNCCYLDIYEQRLKQRHPKTCQWFLGNEKYCRWKNIPFDADAASEAGHFGADWQQRILFVQGESIKLRLPILELL
jgi:hypothetical protein